MHCNLAWICNHMHLFQDPVLTVCWSEHMLGPDYNALCGIDVLDAVPRLTLQVTVMSLCIVPFWFNPYQFAFLDVVIDYWYVLFFVFSIRFSPRLLNFSEFLQWRSHSNSRSNDNSWIGYCRLSRTPEERSLVTHWRSCQMMFLRQPGAWLHFGGHIPSIHGRIVHHCIHVR